MRNPVDRWTAGKIAGLVDGHPAEKLDRQLLDSYTQRKLRQTLEYAVSNSSFYRDKYGAATEEIRGDFRGDFMEFFANLPFSTAQELRSRGTDFLCVGASDISRVVTLDTGGSTGAPKRIYFTEEDQQLTVDYFANGMKLIVDRCDTVLILMPAKMPGSIGRLLSSGLRSTGVATIDYGLPRMGPAVPARQNMAEAETLLHLMEAEGVTAVVALPTHMKMLAQLQQKRAGISPLRRVLLSAEYVDDEDVRRIESAFGCRVYEHYGMTEMGLGCAVSCGQGAGYHVREADLYLEIIDPRTGRPAGAGETGEVVFTTLTRTGMPFIRYRTGDYSRWLTEPCPCGSLLKRLDKVGPREAVKGYLQQSREI